MPPTDYHGPVPDPTYIATQWLEGLAAAANDADIDAFAGSLVAAGWMRANHLQPDLLCFSWDYRCLNGNENITTFLSESIRGQTRLNAAGLHSFQVQATSTLGPPALVSSPLDPSAQAIQAVFEYSISSPPGRGRGFVRLVEEQRHEWKALTILFTLHEIKGHEEPRVRPTGLFPDFVTWDEIERERKGAIEGDPTVLIANVKLVVGGSLTGLICAARLTKLNVRALVIEKDARIGDVWRNRKLFPKYIPRVKLADFLEAYATGEDLVVWTSCELLPIPKYDSASKHWSVTIHRGGERQTLRPKHIIMATGNGKAYKPEFPGIEKFIGLVYHSDDHRGATPFKGKRAVVVGACNAAADMCIDFFAKGAHSVTMIQRSATCVISANAADTLVYDRVYNERFAVEDADFGSLSMPTRLGLKLAAAGSTKVAKAFDKELFDGLERAGFALTWELTPGGGEVGAVGFVAERAGAGSMMDLGCGRLIIDGKVEVKRGSIARLEADSVVFEDESRVGADVLVLATGYKPVIDNIKELFGPEITDTIGFRLGGIDEEGEHMRAYRPSGHAGLWFALGLLPQIRAFSKYLILAEELGLKETEPV
ncbi:predicted protein [Postia placenta Mad-698-R]|uniref:FAD/NAD(P)-binding domain-containing protein n=1 Tax=Postia placenta MAD-698-R-SB12 TaxID=670580 RepID=A0A1X6MMS5_9APHY|nr:hypothetical protein POSPLADRAFT_1050055 [Postia placenta MAD-698-R-SB12]EED82794.1 predicted protein [Postia placenta Mad-698-R]OSX57383.1 hypothetical protein POSPLADRAFT_1050055 [Postia placenta MAD-698-R-SB12]